MKKPLLNLAVFVASAVMAWWIAEPDTASQSKPEITKSDRQNQRAPSTIGHKHRQEFALLHSLKDPGEKLRYLISLASTIPVEEIRSLYESGILAALDERLVEVFEEIALDRWLEAAPEEMMKWLVISRVSPSNIYLARWAGWAPEEALAFAQSLPAGVFNSPVRDLIRELLRVNPEQAVFLARTPSLGIGRVEGLNPEIDDLAYELALVDREAFAEMQANWPPKARERNELALGAVLLKEDFTKGLEFLKEREEGWKGLVEALMRDRSETVMKTLLNHVEQLPDGWMESILTSQALGYWSNFFLPLLETDAASLGVEPDFFIERARSLASNPGGRAYLNEPDRKRVMDLINQTSVDRIVRENLLRTQIKTWPAYDDEALVAWLDTLADQSLAAVAEQSSLAREQKSDRREPENPSEKLTLMARGETNEGFEAQQWSQEEIEAARRTFSALDLTEKERVLKLIARDELNNVLHSEFAGELFSGAFQLAEQGVEIHELMVQLPGVVTHWARGQPSAAATWVESLPAGEIRTQAMGIVAKEWHNYSTSEARKWVESLSQAEQAHVNQLLEGP